MSSDPEKPDSEKSEGATCQVCGETGIEDILAHDCPPKARPWQDGKNPIALAYDDAGDGELIAKLYTPEVVAECQDSWWIRVEIIDEQYKDGGPA